MLNELLPAHAEAATQYLNLALVTHGTSYFVHGYVKLRTHALFVKVTPVGVSIHHRVTFRKTREHARFDLCEIADVKFITRSCDERAPNRARNKVHRSERRV